MNERQQSLFDTEPAPWDLDEAGERLMATVVFSDGPSQEFDYLVPDRLGDEVQAGRRVRVPFGRGDRSVVGYCVESKCGSSSRRLKEIKAVLDAAPLLSASMLQLTKWMADHYLCSWGQAIEAAVPSGVRSRAGTREITLLSVPTSVAARLTQLRLPRKQATALRRLAASPMPLTPPQLAAAAGCTLAPIHALRKKELIRAESQRVQLDRDDDAPLEDADRFVLNADQRKALDAILKPLRSAHHQTVLVHGVTGSGKTEVYIRAIEEVIQFGRQAIVLVPEISLTPQTRRRFRARFARVAVLHSHLSAAERHWHWRRIARGEVQVIVGARSAVFAPAPNLGMIVLDEEHDFSFKQDSSPRYHARDVALYRTKMERVPLVLGSATPSLESWQRAVDGDYQLVEMPRRVGNRPLPDVAAIDLRNEFRNRQSRGAVSRPLHSAIGQALDAGGQVILLLNRRGFATQIQCPSCGYVVRCPDCDIALTHHRTGEKAICHYCDYKIEAPPTCPDCRFEGIRYSGLGTQRLEMEIRSRFPDVECLRMDSDAMQKHGSHEAALERFRSGEVRILLGTQMIAKGLDFPNVTLVGVINADTALHFPDFRAAERTFGLVTQVAGRTGRGEKGGRVLVQTFSPEHPAIIAAMKHDYEMFAGQELPTRREFGYPPFTSMIRIVIRGPTEKTAEQFADHVSDRLRQVVKQCDEEVRIVGAAPAPLAKLRGKYRFHALMLGPNSEILRSIFRTATDGRKVPDGVQWTVDVDPVDLL